MARRNRRIVEEEMEVEEVEQEQRDETPLENPPPAQEDVVDQDTQRMANELVRLILFEEQSRAAIRKTAIYKHIISDTITGYQRSKVYKTVVALAQQKFKTVFGMDLVWLPAREYPQDEVIISNAPKSKKRPNKKAKTEEEDSSDVFILQTALPGQFRQIVSPLRSSKEREFYGYAYIFCSIILLSDKGYLEKSFLIADSLFPLGLDATKIDVILGKLIKYRYLLSKNYKDTRGDKFLIYYSLGPRAKVEFKDNEGFKHICALILGDKFTDKTSEQIDIRLKAVNMLSQVDEPAAAQEPEGDSEPEGHSGR